MVITLPWPPTVLRPNDTSHWSKKAKAKAKYKEWCYWATKLSKVRIADEKVHLYLTFHPPSRRRYDADNLLASIKSGIDGLAEALGVNDRIFSPITVQIADFCKRGKIVIEFPQNTIRTDGGFVA